MVCSRARLLSSIRSRGTRSRLTTADRYLRSIDGCLDADPRALDMLKRLEGRDWQRELEAAESRFVYCADARPVVPRQKTEPGIELPEGSILEFEAVITTTRRDRDGDVLEAAGAEVDPDAVLLWQHIPFQPIGKLVEVTEHSAQRVKARLSIADTELGRDAATLATFGAVKISHGFEPRVFEPLPDHGWHIKRFEIFEVSLVSIPSNRDAVITAFSRQKLHSPFFREWARRLADERTRPVRGSGRVDRTAGDAHEIGNQEETLPALDAACRQFMARALLAEPADADTLRRTHDALGKVIDHVA